MALSVTISRAPLAKIRAYQARMGWSFADSRYLIEELPGVSVFAVGEGGELFPTYSTFARRLDMLLTADPSWRILNRPSG